MVTNNIKSANQIKIFILAFFITAAVICVYAFTQIGVLSRVSAPFEGSMAEPNTLAGYLLLLFAVSMGIFLHSPSSNWRFLSGGLAFLMIIPFIFTFSRTAYIAFIPMYLILVLLAPRNKVLLIAMLILGILTVSFVFPRVRQMIIGRVEETFTPYKVYGVLGKKIPLEESAAARIEGWRIILQELKKSPLFGFGVTGVGLVDAQYPRVLGETGILGFIIFLLLLRKIFRQSLFIFHNITDEWSKGLAFGFFAGFIALLFQGFGANNFIIVRIMEPFWFLAAVVMMLPFQEGLKARDDSPAY